MTRLDHNRAISQLAAKTGTTVNDVTKMTIWGNHSATQYPDLFHAEVNGQNAYEAWSTIRPGTRALTSPPSPSAARRSSRPAAPRRPPRPPTPPSTTSATWSLGTPEGDWVSMAVAVRRQRTACPRASSLVPVHHQGRRVQIVQGLEIDEFSRGKIDASVAELAEERDAVKELGLIEGPPPGLGWRPRTRARRGAPTSAHPLPSYAPAADGNTRCSERFRREPALPSGLGA
jgi:malate dehydrogenase